MEKHLYPFGVLRTKHRPPVIHQRRNLPRTQETWEQRLSLSAVLTWRILLLIESRQGEEVLFCLCMYLLSLLLCTSPHLWPDELLVIKKDWWSWETEEDLGLCLFLTAEGVYHPSFS